MKNTSTKIHGFRSLFEFFSISVINGSSIPQKTVSTNGFKMTKVRNLFMELVKKFFAVVPYDGAAA